MVRKKAGEDKVQVGDIHEVSGEVNIAAGDIYKGFTADQVSVLITQITSTFRPKPFDGRCPYKGLDVFEEEDVFNLLRCRFRSRQTPDKTDYLRCNKPFR
jgi:hypothetical protein